MTVKFLMKMSLFYQDLKSFLTLKLNGDQLQEISKTPTKLLIIVICLFTPIET